MADHHFLYFAVVAPTTGASYTAVMLLGSPIGSNQGYKTRDFLSIIIDQAQVPVVIDMVIDATVRR